MLFSSWISEIESPCFLPPDPKHFMNLMLLSVSVLECPSYSASWMHLSVFFIFLFTFPSFSVWNDKVPFSTTILLLYVYHWAYQFLLSMLPCFCESYSLRSSDKGFNCERFSWCDNHLTKYHCFKSSYYTVLISFCWNDPWRNEKYIFCWRLYYHLISTSWHDINFN